MPSRLPAACDDRVFEQRLRRLGERRPFVFPGHEIPGHYRRSSVLIGFWRDERALRVLLTKRAETLSGHPGQMSFPGGRLDAGESWAEAALRETEEEVGIPRASIEVLGRLDDAWSGAGHLVVPIVGWMSAPPRFDPNPAEVAEVHTPSLEELLAPEAYSEEEAHFGDDTFLNPTLRWRNGHVFGLSTNLLIEVLEWATAVGEAPGPARLVSLRAYLRHFEKGERPRG